MKLAEPHVEREEGKGEGCICPYYQPVAETPRSSILPKYRPPLAEEVGLRQLYMDAANISHKNPIADRTRTDEG